MLAGRCLEDVPEALLVVLPELAEGAPRGLTVRDRVGPLPPTTRVLNTTSHVLVHCYIRKLLEDFSECDQ